MGQLNKYFWVHPFISDFCATLFSSKKKGLSFFGHFCFWPGFIHAIFWIGCTRLWLALYWLLFKFRNGKLSILTTSMFEDEILLLNILSECLFNCIKWIIRVSCWTSKVCQTQKMKKKVIKCLKSKIYSLPNVAFQPLSWGTIWK